MSGLLRDLGWWPLAAASGLYLAQAWSYYRAGDYPLVVTFLAYALANVGFVLDFVSKVSHVQQG